MTTVHKTQNTTLLANLFTCPRFVQFALHEFFLNWFPRVPKLHPLLEEVLHTVSLLSHSPEFALCPSLVTLNCSQPSDSQVTRLERWPLAHWMLCSIPGACCPVGTPSATDHGPTRLLSMMSPFPLTMKWSVSALIFCLSSSSSIWFRLQCPFLPQFSLVDRFFPPKNILSYWFPSPRLLWQLGIHVTFITKTILFDDCLWLEK